MRVRVGSGRAAAVVVLAAAALSGCSTVMRSQHSESAAVHERKALVEAARAVSHTSWPEVEGGDWGGRMFAGIRGSDAEEQTAKIYLAGLAGRDRKAAVMDAAAGHLEAATALTAAAKEASRAINPSETDVAVVETAIGDLRDARNVYVECLKALVKDRAANLSEVKALKRAFDQSMENLGDVADQLAVRAEQERARSFAGPRGFVSS